MYVCMYVYTNIQSTGHFKSSSNSIVINFWIKSSRYPIIYNFKSNRYPIVHKFKSISKDPVVYNFKSSSNLVVYSLKSSSSPLSTTRRVSPVQTLTAASRLAPTVSKSHGTHLGSTKRPKRRHFEGPLHQNFRDGFFIGNITALNSEDNIATDLSRVTKEGKYNWPKKRYWCGL